MAPRWTRATMVVQIVLGVLRFLVTLDDGAVVDVGIGCDVLWALGRGDVTAWLAGAAPPVGPLPGTG